MNNICVGGRCCGVCRARDPIPTHWCLGAAAWATSASAVCASSSKRCSSSRWRRKTPSATWRTRRPWSTCRWRSPTCSTRRKSTRRSKTSPPECVCNRRRYLHNVSRARRIISLARERARLLLIAAALAWIKWIAFFSANCAISLSHARARSRQANWTLSCTLKPITLGLCSHFLVRDESSFSLPLYVPSLYRLRQFIFLSFVKPRNAPSFVSHNIFCLDMKFQTSYHLNICKSKKLAMFFF